MPAPADHDDSAAFLERFLSPPAGRIRGADDGRSFRHISSDTRRFLIIVHSRSLGALCRRLNKQAGTGKLIVIEEEITDPAGTVPRGGARRRIILKSRESSSWMEKEKLDLLHHAAMTIGHEINDPLMIISAEAETIIKKYPGSKAEIISRMKEVSRAAARIAAVMEELRTIETISYRYLAGNRILDFDFGENRRGTGDGLFTRSPEFIA